jgi:hypothetical protein
MGEMVARFVEREEWCSCLKTSGSRVCDLTLGLADGQVPLVTRLEELAGQFWVMQDERQALQRLATRVWDLVVEGSNEALSLTVALSLTADLIECHVDVVASNGALWDAWLALTTVLLHFLELEHELELLGSEYNTAMMRDDMEVFWTRSCRASESLSSRAPLLVARSSPDGAGDE